MSRTVRLAALSVACLAAVVVGVAWGLTKPASNPPLRGEMAGFVLTGGTPSPEISFSDGAGNSVDLTDFTGQVVLLNFWATWCAPCVHEMPALDRLQAHFAGQDFAVIALSIDRGGVPIVERFYTDHGLEALGTYTDTSGRVPQSFGVNGLPTTVLIDRDGSWVGSFEGAAEWDGADALALINHYVERQS